MPVGWNLPASPSSLTPICDVHPSLCPCPRQDCVTKARAALSPALLAAATAAAAAQDGLEIVEAAAAEAGAADTAEAAHMAAGAAGAAAVAFEDRALTRKEEASLLHPLLRLRQACCHPQVGRITA